jgi:hypothetical protein
MAASIYQTLCSGNLLPGQKNNYIDTFGDKPQCSALGNQSRKPEGLKIGFGKGLVALSVNPEDAKYRKQAPMLVIGVFRRVDRRRGQIYHR